MGLEPTIFASFSKVTGKRPCGESVTEDRGQPESIHLRLTLERVNT
jgi:hypothetical protein